MNKKLNTALFFLVATIVNIVLVLVIALGLLIPYVWLAQQLKLDAGVNLMGLVVILIGSLALSFPIYRQLVAMFQKRVDLEKHFDPIIVFRSKRPPRD